MRDGVGEGVEGIRGRIPRVTGSGGGLTPHTHKLGESGCR